jgi:hypothetical protein
LARFDDAVGRIRNLNHAFAARTHAMTPCYSAAQLRRCRESKRRSMRRQRQVRRGRHSADGRTAIPADRTANAVDGLRAELEKGGEQVSAAGSGDVSSRTIVVFG